MTTNNNGINDVNADQSQSRNYINDYDQSSLNDIDPDLNYFDSINKIPNTIYYENTTYITNYGTTNHMSLFHLNIRSIPENFIKLLSYIDSLHTQFKIIALCETWIKPYHADHTIPHYNLEQEYRSKKRGGGDDPESVNSLFIEVDKNCIGSKCNVIVACIYRPPWAHLSIFNESLAKLLEMISKENKLVYILGDMNVDIAPNATFNVNIDNFHNTFSSHHFYPLINQPTRVTPTSSSVIDNVYCNSPLPSDINDVGILRPYISDHHAIFCIVKLTTLKNEINTFTKRSFTKKNIAKFGSYLRRLSWDDVFQSSSTQLAFGSFKRVFDLYFVKSFPKQTHTINYETCLPWMSEELRKDIVLKNNLHIMSAKFPSDIIMGTLAKHKRNQTNSDLKNAEINYYSNQFELHKSDLVKSWKTLKTIIGKHVNNSKRKLSFLVNGETISDSLTIAKEFNKFFISIGPELASNISCSVNPLSYIINVNNSIVVPFVVQNEIRCIISDMKNSSPGWDEIPPQYAKLFVNFYIEPLTYIINLSLMEGVFPSELKVAKVIPVFKGGDSSILSNYRPISVLTLFSKIFEKVVYKSVLRFMDDNLSLYKYQFGFRQQHSCQQAIITLIDKITSCLDTGDIVIGVFIDLKKAFDTVNHKILLKKLYAYGIRGSILKWLDSYLSDRLQYVYYNGSESNSDSITCGVPQGSILGPLLFIIYMNDIFNVSNFLFTILYADDTCVIANGVNIYDLMNLLNKELSLISIWLKSNKLSPNVKKSYYVLFHRAKIKIPTCSISLIIDNCTISKTDCFKYLGVIIDCKLSWIPHITYVKNKVSKGIGIIYKARRYLNRRSLLNLYHSFVYPYLIYSVEVWGNAAQCHINQLLLVQKRIIIIISYSEYKAPSTPLFRSLDILPIDKLVHNRIGIMMYKYVNDLLPLVMSELYTYNRDIHHHNTRQSNLFHLHKGNTNIYTNSFKYRSSQIWNFLQLNMDVNVSLSEFKRSFK